MNSKSLLGLLFIFISLSVNAQEGQILVEQTQKSLITKRTATWCPLCGASNVWPMVKNMNTNLDGKALVIAGHHSSGSDLHSPTAADFINNFEQSFGQPRFYFNSELVGNGGSNTQSELESKANLAFDISPIAQSGLVVTYDNIQQLLDVNGRAEFFQTATGSYYLGYYFIRKSVIANQSSQSGSTEHINVLWESITDGSFGELITDQGANNGSSFSLRKQIALPDGLDVANLLIAAIIWKENAEGKFEVVNVETNDNIELAVVSRTYQHSEIESFIIQPNVTQESSLAVFKLDEGIKGAEIAIYNWYGQKIKTVFQGNLTAGDHQFPLTVDESGFYIVSIRSGNQISSQRLIKVN